MTIGITITIITIGMTTITIGMTMTTTTIGIIITITIGTFTEDIDKYALLLKGLK